MRTVVVKVIIDQRDDEGFCHSGCVRLARDFSSNLKLKYLCNKKAKSSLVLHMTKKSKWTSPG